MKIYADVLILTNCIITLIYLQTLAAVTHRRLNGARLAAAAVTGGLFSLIIAADSNSFAGAVLITLIKWAAIALTLIIAVSFHSPREFFTTLLIYFAIRLAYTGVILVYWQLSDSKRIYARNYTAYFDISLTKLLAAVISAYILLTLYEAFQRRFHDKYTCYKAVYQNGDFELHMPAVADSGNRLCDSFTGTPVVIFYCSAMYYHYELESPEMCIKGGFRFIPFHTVGGGGLVPVTPKGSVTIIDEKGNKRAVKCFVGILKSDNEKARAIFNPALLK